LSNRKEMYLFLIGIVGSLNDYTVINKKKKTFAIYNILKIEFHSFIEQK